MAPRSAQLPKKKMVLRFVASFSVVIVLCCDGLSPKAKSLTVKPHVQRPAPVRPSVEHHPDSNVVVSDEHKKRKFLKSSEEVAVLGVLDFECTCEPGWGYLHEVIEFPLILVDAKTREIVDEFHSYVRPTENATLSGFCTELTGIDQATVDAAPTLPEVLQKLDDWLEARDLVDGPRHFACATDGWDLQHFLDRECARKSIPTAKYLEKWVDLTKVFDERRSNPNHKHQKQRRRTNLSKMLRFYGMKFDGRPHSGLDDARNIARVAMRMLKEKNKPPLVLNDCLPRLFLLPDDEKKHD